MKIKAILGVILSLSLVGSTAFAEDLYIAQTTQGNDSGTSAANAHSVAWFNTSGNWAAGTNKISPGDTVHLCGTITGQLNVQSSGSAGNRITILFEPNAKISGPFLPASGAINLASYNYITIDGGVNGLMECTANGTSFANHVGSIGINGRPSIGEITVQNLVMTNLYVRVPESTDQTGGVQGVLFYGNMTNIDVHNIKVYGAEQGVLLLYGVGNPSGSWQVYSNVLINCNWGIGVADGNSGALLRDVDIHDNRIDGAYVWDDPADTFHHNGVYCYAQSGNSTITNLKIHNNVIGPHVGANQQNATATIFLSANLPVGIINLDVYNNILYGNSTNQPMDGFIMLWAVGPARIYNNTIDGGGSSANGIRVFSGANVTLYNNIIANLLLPVYLDMPSALTDSRNNLFYNDSGSFYYQTGWTSFSGWQSHGYDTAAITTDPKFIDHANFNFNLSSNSPAIRAGTNLFSVFTTDNVGSARPSSGAWDMGALQFATGGVVSSNLPPVVSAIGQNASDVDPITPGLQIYEGTIVQYSGSASDPNNNPLTWQWIYTVNGGSEVVFQSGSGTVPSVNFNYPSGTAGNAYVWTLRVSDGQLTSQSQLTVSVEPPPSAGQGLTFAAGAGTITLPFVLLNGSISQTTLTSTVLGGGIATYNFSITNAGNYVVQALVNAPSDAGNSLYVAIDGTPQDPAMIWDIPLTSGFEQRIVSWRGNGTDTSNQFVPEVFNLTAGSHQIVFVGREANTQLQSFSILQLPNPPRNLRVLPTVVPSVTFTAGQ